MPEENKTVELKDEELNKVTGGAIKAKRVSFKYSDNQLLRGKYDKWVYKVKELLSAYGSPDYNCEVVKVSDNYKGTYKVGDLLIMSEDELEPYNG